MHAIFNSTHKFIFNYKLQNTTLIEQAKDFQLFNNSNSLHQLYNSSINKSKIKVKELE